MRFIDLFAGLGGFHKALKELGHECVFASEISQPLCDLYEKNWEIKPFGDIKKILNSDISAIPEHDILCAGFPCQPFSKAGNQLGMKDEKRGTLFDDIITILEFRKPSFFILENVPFIAKHNNEETWTYIKEKLEELHYTVDEQIYSPHQFGIPQHRERIFIVGSLHGLRHFCFEEINLFQTDKISINDYIIDGQSDVKKISKQNIDCLKLWQEFISAVPSEEKIPGFPIWSMEFGATYPYEGTPPKKLESDELARYKGSFGQSLRLKSHDEQLKRLPSYARVEDEFPAWKKNYIKLNREFYKNNKKYLEDTVHKLAEYPSQSWQKLEWNVGEGERNIFNYIIQFRPSGVRVKKVDLFPSLVCTNTQIPILGWQQRYLSKEEGLKLQSLEGIELPSNDNAAFKALGNAVNSKIVKLIASKLIIEK